MADAPKPSGGGGWTALEIVLVLILAIAFLSQLRGKPITTESLVTERKDVQLTQQQPTDCGISVLRPKPLEVVGPYVTVSGTISGCGWEMKNGIAAYARIYDAYGTLISDFTPIYPTKVTKANVVFSGTIAFITQPVPDTGYIVFYPASYREDIDSADGITAVIPLRF